MMNKYADIYVFQWGNEGRAGVPERRIRKRSGRGEEESKDEEEEEEEEEEERIKRIMIIVVIVTIITNEKYNNTNQVKMMRKFRFLILVNPVRFCN